MGEFSVVVNYLFKSRLVLPKVSGIVLDRTCQAEVDLLVYLVSGYCFVEAGLLGS